MQRNLWLCLVCLLCACAARTADPVLEELRIISIEGDVHTFQIEIADTTSTRARGLMYRKSLPSDQGMLLVYPTPQRVSIWMKNTYIPLDIFYVGRYGEIVSIVTDAKPLSLKSMPSAVDVLAVLELNAGESAKRGIKVGDQVVHPVFK